MFCFCYCNQLIWKWERTLKTQVGSVVPSWTHCLDGLQMELKTWGHEHFAVVHCVILCVLWDCLKTVLYSKVLLGYITRSLYFATLKLILSVTVVLCPFLCLHYSSLKGQNTQRHCILNFFLTFEKWMDVLNLALIIFGGLYIIRIWKTHISSNGIWQPHIVILKFIYTYCTLSNMV